MKKKLTNEVHLEGYLYDSNLELKTSGAASKNPGTEFISGTINIATDEECTNVVQVHYTYVTAVTSKGKMNATYNVLQAIIDGTLGSVIEDGKEKACRLRVDTAVGLNEWYDSRNDYALISTKRNEGGFVHQAQALSAPDKRCTFDTDMLITSAIRVEPDEENERPERMLLKGCIFDFRNSILPVEFVVYNPKGMDYFEEQNISNKNPLFTEVRGTQVSRTIVKTIEEESAFGDAFVKEVKSSQREFVVTWTKPLPYDWGGDDMTVPEFEELMAAREIYLAELKRRQDEYEANRNKTVTAKATEVKKSVFDF